MPRWPHRVLIALVVLLVILGALYYWFIFDGRPSGTVPGFTIDMAKVRTLAAEQPGERATEVRVETIATMDFPATAVVAGEGWGGFPMGVFSYQLVFPHQTIVLDTALDEADGAGMGAKFDQAAYGDMDRAMANAAQIVITHEHPDHIGGILKYPNGSAIVKKLSLSVEQVASAGKFAGFSALPPVLAEASPIAYDDYFAVAPGVVLIKSAGHSPGSQMVFVQRADGKEYLFTGDIGWSMRNIDEVRGRPRLVSQFMLSNEDRDAVFGELQALHDLKAKEPNLVIVPGHDLGVVNELVAAGTLVAGFADQAP